MLGYPDDTDDYARIDIRRSAVAVAPANCESGTVVTTVTDFTSQVCPMRAFIQALKIVTQPAYTTALATDSATTPELLSAKNDNLDLDFSAAETYDCSGESQYTVNASMKDFKVCIEAFEID